MAIQKQVQELRGDLNRQLKEKNYWNDLALKKELSQINRNAKLAQMGIKTAGDFLLQSFNIRQNEIEKDKQIDWYSNEDQKWIDSFYGDGENKDGLEEFQLSAAFNAKLQNSASIDLANGTPYSLVQNKLNGNPEQGRLIANQHISNQISRFEDWYGDQWRNGNDILPGLNRPISDILIDGTVDEKLQVHNHLMREWFGQVGEDGNSVFGKYNKKWLSIPKEFGGPGFYQQIREKEVKLKEKLINEANIYASLKTQRETQSAFLEVPSAESMRNFYNALKNGVGIDGKAYFDKGRYKEFTKRFWDTLKAGADGGIIKLSDWADLGQAIVPGTETYDKNGKINGGTTFAVMFPNKFRMDLSGKNKVLGEFPRASLDFQEKYSDKMEEAKEAVWGDNREAFINAMKETVDPDKRQQLLGEILENHREEALKDKDFMSAYFTSWEVKPANFEETKQKLMDDPGIIAGKVGLVGSYADDQEIKNKIDAEKTITESEEFKRVDKLLISSIHAGKYDQAMNPSVMKDLLRGDELTVFNSLRSDIYQLVKNQVPPETAAKQVIEDWRAGGGGYAGGPISDEMIKNGDLLSEGITSNRYSLTDDTRELVNRELLDEYTTDLTPQNSKESIAFSNTIQSIKGDKMQALSGFNKETQLPNIKAPGERIEIMEVLNDEMLETKQVPDFMINNYKNYLANDKSEKKLTFSQFIDVRLQSWGEKGLDESIKKEMNGSAALGFEIEKVIGVRTLNDLLKNHQNYDIDQNLSEIAIAGNKKEDYSVVADACGLADYSVYSENFLEESGWDITPVTQNLGLAILDHSLGSISPEWYNDVGLDMEEDLISNIYQNLNEKIINQLWLDPIFLKKLNGLCGSTERPTINNNTAEQ